LDLTARMFHIFRTYADHMHYLIFDDIGRFILSPQFAALNRKYGEHALHSLHQSLNIEDRIAALIRKQKLLTYPEGSSFAGKHIHSICDTYAKPMFTRCPARILI
jgi:hypothetical protein